MRNTIITKISEEKIIAIIRGVKSEKITKVAEALFEGGIRLAEITYDAGNEAGDEDVAQNISKIAKEFQGRMFIGAGTVLTKKQVQLTKLAGGSFIISPNVSEEIVKETIKNDMVSIPGALTPTEIFTAMKAGADFVKIFPASVLGDKYIKAIKAPFPSVRILVVGGINSDNMESYYRSGVSGFGVGANIVNAEHIKNDDYESIKNLAKRYTDNVKAWER